MIDVEQRALRPFEHHRTAGADRLVQQQRVVGRLALALVFSLIAVGIEVLLNQLDVLHWHWWWWDWPFIPLIVVFDYLWFFLAAAHAHDLQTDRARFRFVAQLAAVAATLAVVTALLGWIEGGPGRSAHEARDIAIYKGTGPIRATLDRRLCVCL